MLLQGKKTSATFVFKFWRILDAWKIVTGVGVDKYMLVSLLLLLAPCADTVSLYRVGLNERHPKRPPEATNKIAIGIGVDKDTLVVNERHLNVIRDTNNGFSPWPPSRSFNTSLFLCFACARVFKPKERRHEVEKNLDMISKAFDFRSGIFTIDSVTPTSSF